MKQIAEAGISSHDIGNIPSNSYQPVHTIIYIGREYGIFGDSSCLDPSVY